MKINYNGMELEEFKPEKPEIFLRPRKALCWDGDNYEMSFRSVCNVFAVVPYMNPPVYTESRDGRQDSSWYHCALLPDPPKPRRATWLDVARWCATGNGLVYDSDRDKIDTGIMFKPSNASEPIMDEIKVRKWSDNEWHNPTVDYLFGGEP